MSGGVDGRGFVLATIRIPRLGTWAALLCALRPLRSGSCIWHAPADEPFHQVRLPLERNVYVADRRLPA